MTRLGYSVSGKGTAYNAAVSRRTFCPVVQPPGDPCSLCTPASSPEFVDITITSGLAFGGFCAGNPNGCVQLLDTVLRHQKLPNSCIWEYIWPNNCFTQLRFTFEVQALQIWPVYRITDGGNVATYRGGVSLGPAPGPVNCCTGGTMAFQSGGNFGQCGPYDDLAVQWAPINCGGGGFAAGMPPPPEGLSSLFT